MVATIIGGNGHKWRGRAIRPIFKDGSTCASMSSKDSMVMSSCEVVPNTKYEISVSASKNSGNGLLLVNFFGGRDYDGTPAQISVVSQSVSVYKVVISTPKFPKGIPIQFRIWKPGTSTGNVYIKTIKFDKVVATAPETRGTIIVPPKTPPPSLLPKQKPPEGRPPKPKQPAQQTVKRVFPKIKKPAPVVTKEATRVPTSKRYAELISTVSLPLVSIVTPTRNGRDLIEKCYIAIKENTYYPNWEWIIGDSDSTDGTQDLVKSWQDPRIKFVERGTTAGSFSSINNELVKYSAGEYLLFLNDDTQPQPFWLCEMMSKIYTHPEIGIVGAQLLYCEGKIQHAGIAFIPNGPVNIGKSVLKSMAPDFASSDRYLQAVTGACLLISKVDFINVGCFDPIYYFCYEDVDLCLKVKISLGKKILYAASAKVLHAESVTQRKYKTAGELQRVGISAFKNKWSRKVTNDLVLLTKDSSIGLKKVDVSFITCVSSTKQYVSDVIVSLLKNKTKRNYEIIPIFNHGNKYSAAQALNLGITKARGEIIVLCHQDVVFFDNWVDLLFKRIAEVEQKTTKWGVLGTAGINSADSSIGTVYNMKGYASWSSTCAATVLPVQTVDEHCMIIRKNSGLLFDEKTVKGFHFYGADLCLNASVNKGLHNYGIVCPLVHNSGSGSMNIGKGAFDKLMDTFAQKWRKKVSSIRTTTSIINKNTQRTFLKFKKK